MSSRLQAVLQWNVNNVIYWLTVQCSSVAACVSAYRSEFAFFTKISRFVT